MGFDHAKIVADYGDARQEALACRTDAALFDFSFMSRAIIRDLYAGAELARNLAFATMFFALGPVIAPFAGSFLDGQFGEDRRGRADRRGEDEGADRAQDEAGREHGGEIQHGKPDGPHAWSTSATGRRSERGIAGA